MWLSTACCLLIPPYLIIRRGMIFADDSYCGVWIIIGVDLICISTLLSVSDLVHDIRILQLIKWIMSVLHWIHSPLDLNKINKWKPNRLSILLSGGYDSRRAAVDGTFQVSSAGSAAVLARCRRPCASRFSLLSKNGRPTTRRRNAQEKQRSFSDELQCDRRPTTKTRRCKIFQKFDLK